MNDPIIRFFVPGIPKPAGSKTAFRHDKTKKVVVIDACKKSRSWKTTVSEYAMTVMVENGFSPFGPGLPIWLGLVFYMPRPKAHYRTGKHSDEIKPNAPFFHTVKPDATKLLRAVEDALTGVCWHDDSQISSQACSKIYSDIPGVKVSIMAANEHDELTE